MSGEARRTMHLSACSERDIGTTSAGKAANFVIALRLLASFAVLWLGSVPLPGWGGSGAQAGERLAMVLAAEDYTHFKRSGIGAKRGEEIGELLRARGFEVVVATNPANATARAALRDFAAKVATADVALAVLIGHGLSSVGQTFFVPSNASIDRSTDLLSRGLSVTNISQIVSKARAGGVCFLMTTPDFAKPIDGVDMRPHLEGQVVGNVATAFSNSTRIPISRMDAAAELAASEVIDLLRKQPGADLRQFINSCASQQGVVFGTPVAIGLAKPPKAAGETEASGRKGAPEKTSTDPGEADAALEALEKLLDPRQVRRIQQRLAQMGLYQGPIDAIIGVLTRDAIREYQKKNGAPETGYLTPEQLKALTAGPQ